MDEVVVLKENNSKEQGTADKCRKRNKYAKKEDCQQRQRRCMTCGIGVFIALVIIVAIVAVSFTVDPLVGRWDMDEVTSYEFRRNGKGVMILPSAQYEFSYTVKDNMLYIDFDYEDARDAQYEFTINGDMLTLNGGNIAAQGTYVLSRRETKPDRNQSE